MWIIKYANHTRKSISNDIFENTLVIRSLHTFLIMHIYITQVVDVLSRT